MLRIGVGELATSLSHELKQPITAAITNGARHLPVSERMVGQPEAIQKRAPEELTLILLLLGWEGVGIRVELLVCGAAFQLSAVPVHRNGGRRFLSTVPWSIRRDTEFARFYARWR